MTNNRKIKIVIVFIFVFILGTTFLSTKSWAQEQSISVISTRGHFDLNSGNLTSNHNATDYNTINISKCSPEIVIFVHGWNTNEGNASEQFNRTLLSLKANGFNNTLIGYSWDSNTASHKDLNWKAWINAKTIATENGPKLAHFIIDYMNNCKKESRDIRLIGHSLGARVVLSTLESLYENDTWNKNNYKISSVHLLGAAVDNEEISKDKNNITKDITNILYNKTTPYGLAIEKEVTDFFNLYNPEDNYLKPGFYQIYPSYEFGDMALGQSGYQTMPFSIAPSLPKNYVEINVKNEILPICDADGDKKPDTPFRYGSEISTGDNHHGYMGYRNSTDKSKLIDDGAVNIIVDNWKHIPPKIDQNAEETAVCNLN